MARSVTTAGGRTLTKADLDRLAADVERSLDISSWTPRRGRPSLSKAAGVHSPRIAVRLPEDLHRRALARAATEGRSISDVVRDLLDQYARDAGPGTSRS